ncbi:MAG: cell division FtsA domain-containing protein [Bacteroidales bacterium]|nr:cell division FtsA domain-containing protein [Bacteroidales bacterium]
MSKVLRLHTSGVDTLEDWQNCTVYGSNVISQIQDPNGASAKHEITSIPSPFARIDLVKQAFKNVADSQQLEGQTIFHKMVSDSLDIGEIFFKSKTYSDRVKILFWDKTSNIEALLNGTAKQKILGQTLKMYLDQDAKAYNFDKMQRFFILGYTGDKRKTEFDVLGATSPATLFFSIANDLSYISKEISFNTDFPFDSDYNPLVKRDKEYVKYIFALKKSRRDFAELFPEVTAYLDLTYENLDSKTKNEISDFDATTVSNYDSLYTADGNNIVEIISGMTFHTKKRSVDPIDSDFSILSTRKPNEKILVLPVEKGSKYSDLTLTQGKWDGNNPAPYKDTTEVSQRRLPQTNEHIPYLAISDFLEDSIIKMPYKLNTQAFFDANVEPQDVSYFLPLKDKFFEYFTADDITNNRMIEFRKNSGGVKVVLHIPVKGGTIDYERIYFENNEPKIDEHKNNDGGMVNKNDYFGFALMPNVKFEKTEQANYRFVLSTQDDKSKYGVTFYDSDLKQINNVPSSRRNVSYSDDVSNVVYCIEGHNLEYVRISDGKSTGVLLMLMKPQQSSSKFTFAVDFGTSNTHIVYKSDDISTMPLDINAIDKQIQLNSDDLSEDSKKSIYQELCPMLVGRQEVSKFPMRSAFLIGKNTNWLAPHFALGHANFAFFYERIREDGYNKIATNLKWSNDNDNDKIVNCYIESLFFIMRNKVLLNGGTLSDTKVFWTYPLSMTLAKKIKFKAIWNNAYKKYFGPDTSNIVDVNESVAPYYYYKGKIAAINNFVTIDIGGGTSDIVVANGGKIKYVTSFRFAADSIFGDLTTPNAAPLNGIIRQFMPLIEKQLKVNRLSGILSILKGIKDKNNSSDIVSLFFSLKHNKDLRDKNIDIDFHRMLQLDTTQKIVFLLFYCALIYHLAKTMKAQDSEMPRHIGFSGNGSKVIDILTEDTRLLECLTQRIFEKIYGTSYPSDGLSIVLMDNPKEATSVGAIMSAAPKEKSDTHATAPKKITLLGTDSNTLASDDMSYKDVNDNLQKFVEGIKSEAEKFIDFVFSLNNGNMSFRDSFGIDQMSIDIAKENCKRDIKAFAENKLCQKLSEVNQNDKIEETMFFYPLSGMLNTLTGKICEYSSQNTTI